MIHLPPSFRPGKSYPVVLAFHGGGGEYKKVIRYYHLNNLADADEFIVVYPNAIHHAWTLNGVSSRVRSMDPTVDDVHFISVLLDILIQEYQVDSSHVFCTGISRGGIFSLYLAWQLSSRIQAIAPVCASIPRNIFEGYHFSHPIPVMLINGTGDPLIDYNGGPGKLNTRNAGSDQADMLPTEELVKKLLDINHCNPTATIKAIPDSDPEDGCQATEYDYVGPHSKIAFIKIINGGHSWPGGIQYLPKSLIGWVCKDFYDEDKIMAFFKSML
jgi:polyhydroxybutyrate depolymerase